MTHFRVSICSLPNGSIYMYVSAVIKTLYSDSTRPKQSQNLRFLHCCQLWDVKKNVSVTDVNLRQNMIKIPPFLVHTLNILNLHSSSLCHLMFLSNVSNICLLLFAQGAPKQKIHNYPTHVYWFILTLHFILENWLLFWYNCGLHWKKIICWETYFSMQVL